MSEAMDTYGAIHTSVNDTVSDRAGRSVSVTTGRTSSGFYVVSGLASRANGSMIRVIVTLDGERLDSETGRIADSIGDALFNMTTPVRMAYARAWRDVFIPGSHDVVK